MTPECWSGQPIYGVLSRRHSPGGNPEVVQHSEPTVKKIHGTLWNLNGPGQPPRLTDVLCSLTSPDGKRQVLFVSGDETHRGIRNPNPWSGAPERVIFRHKGPGYGDPDVSEDTWKVHTFLLPELTLVEAERILREIAAENESRQAA